MILAAINQCFNVSSFLLLGKYERLLADVGLVRRGCLHPLLSKTNESILIVKAKKWKCLPLFEISCIRH